MEKETKTVPFKNSAGEVIGEAVVVKSDEEIEIYVDIDESTREYEAIVKHAEMNGYSIFAPRDMDEPGKRTLIHEEGGGGDWYFWDSYCCNCGWRYSGGGSLWRWIRFKLHKCKSSFTLFPTNKGGDF